MVQKIEKKDTLYPLISIIVPVYQAEKYLDRCVKSILAQTYLNWELLLVNDGSPDNCGELCNTWSRKDNRIRAFHKENSGVSSARNLGLDNASGEYIMFVDSDDEIAKSTLEICYNEVLKNDVDILQYSLTRDYDDLGKLKKPLEPTDVSKYIENGHFMVCIGGSFIKRSIIENHSIRFDESLKLAEDLLFIHTCFAYARRCQRLLHQLYYYRNNVLSASNNRQSVDMVKSCMVEHKFKCLHPMFAPAIDASICQYILSIIINNDYEYEKLCNLIRQGLPYNRSLMRGSLWVFAFIAQYSIPLAINVVRWKFGVK